MVRLKDYLKKLKEIKLSYFNSSMVRLKGKKDPGCLISGIIFQFLNGAIKRSWSDVNSVRVAWFQFLNGAIKRPSDTITTSPFNYFNSSMVRLKVNALQLAQGLKNEFQFLNGAIKSHLFCSLSVSKLSFQFLNGAIKRWNCCAVALTLRISIPQWCD